MAQTNQTIGRFAPSPSGPLHFGSLVAALASYLDARANHGLWLVRMEDLDPAREPPDAAATILSALEKLGLFWDRTVLYQSKRQEAYSEALEELTASGLVYRCDCSRRQIRAMGGVYSGRCRRRAVPPAGRAALRLQVPDQLVQFRDRIQGLQKHQLQSRTGDFIVKRKDGLFAYQLAVVVDDQFQGVTDVVRGYDLLDSTPRQIYLQRSLSYRTPRYAHFPVITDTEGHKLSKQQFAAPLDLRHRRQLLSLALKCLGHNPPDGVRNTAVEQQLEWAISNWQLSLVPGTPGIGLNPREMQDPAPPETSNRSASENK